MTMTLQLSYGSTPTVINLQAGYYRVPDGYYPASGRGKESLTERIDLVISGTAAERIAAIAAIRDAIRNAILHPDDQLMTYLLFDVDGSRTAWRSRVIDGDVLFDDRLAKRWGHDRVKVGLIVERDPFFEAQTETELALTNGNGSALTGGIRVYDYNDHAVADTSYYRDNYVDIAAGAVEGDLPAAVRFEFGARGVPLMRMGVQHLGTPATAPTQFTNIATLNWSGTGEASLYYWTLSESEYESMGGYYRVLARLTTPSAYTDLILRVYGYSYSQTTYGPRVYAYNQQLVDLGIIRIPPRNLLTTSSPIELALIGIYAQRRTAGSHSLAFDSLQLIPTDYYGEYEETVVGSSYVGGTDYRSYYSSYGAGEAYREYASDHVNYKAQRMYNTRGGVFIEPGKAQRISFQPYHYSYWTKGSWWTQRIWYRPRREAI